MAGISRRGFLKTTAVAAAGTSTRAYPTTLYAETQSLRAVFKKGFLTKIRTEPGAQRFTAERPGRCLLERLAYPR